MCDLKNQIFALLKKCPNRADFNNVTYYKDDATTYNIVLYQFKQGNVPNYIVDLNIYSRYGTHIEQASITEKEYMELKWQIEDWTEVIKNKILGEFKEFTESEPNSMDDLLND